MPNPFLTQDFHIRWSTLTPDQIQADIGAALKTAGDNINNLIEQDRGRTWEEAEALLIAEHPDHAENIRNFRRHWHEMVPHAYEDSVAIMLGLIESGHDVTMLTNFAADTLAEARKRFDFLNRPRGVTISGEIGKIKPDRDIYDHHVAAFGLEPSATLFIDDSQKNVDGAKAAGWQAVLFTDARTLQADLERLGIKARSESLAAMR